MRKWSERVVHAAVSQLKGSARYVWEDSLDGYSMEEIARRHGLANANSAKAIKHNTSKQLELLVRKVVKNGSEDMRSSLPFLLGRRAEAVAA